MNDQIGLRHGARALLRTRLVGSGPDYETALRGRADALT
jgi:hypothetical protein